MAGLLGDVLPYLYSRGDALKRQVNGLLSDPVGSAQQTLGLLADKSRENQNMLAQAFQDPSRPFRVTDQGALGQASTNVLSGLLGFAPIGMTVWHGGGQVFNRFDPGKIGSGEGSQAYGYGHYTAENLGTAKHYAETYGGHSPNLYKIDIDDAATQKMLDWDKTLAQQPESVRKALASEIDKRFQRAIDTYRQPYSGWGLLDEPAPPSRAEYESMPAGKFMKALESEMGAEPAALLLRSLGIPGVRYLDGVSRAAGKGTSNFVVFPGEERLLQILERNGQPLR